MKLLCNGCGHITGGVKDIESAPERCESCDSDFVQLIPDDMKVTMITDNGAKELNPGSVPMSKKWWEFWK